MRFYNPEKSQIESSFVPTQMPWELIQGNIKDMQAQADKYKAAQELGESALGEIKGGKATQEAAAQFRKPYEERFSKAKQLWNQGQASPGQLTEQISGILRDIKRSPDYSKLMADQVAESEAEKRFATTVGQNPNSYKINTYENPLTGNKQPVYNPTTKTYTQVPLSDLSTFSPQGHYQIEHKPDVGEVWKSKYAALKPDVESIAKMDKVSLGKAGYQASGEKHTRESLLREKVKDKLQGAINENWKTRNVSGDATLGFLAKYDPNFFNDPNNKKIYEDEVINSFTGTFGKTLDSETNAEGVGSGNGTGKGKSKNATISVSTSVTGNPYINQNTGEPIKDEREFNTLVQNSQQVFNEKSKSLITDFHDVTGLDVNFDTKNRNEYGQVYATLPAGWDAELSDTEKSNKLNQLRNLNNELAQNQAEQDNLTTIQRVAMANVGLNPDESLEAQWGPDENNKEQWLNKKLKLEENSYNNYRLLTGKRSGLSNDGTTSTITGKVIQDENGLVDINAFEEHIDNMPESQSKEIAKHQLDVLKKEEEDLALKSNKKLQDYKNEVENTLKGITYKTENAYTIGDEGNAKQVKDAVKSIIGQSATGTNKGNIEYTNSNKPLDEKTLNDIKSTLNDPDFWSGQVVMTRYSEKAHGWVAQIQIPNPDDRSKPIFLDVKGIQNLEGIADPSGVLTYNGLSKKFLSQFENDKNTGDMPIILDSPSRVINTKNGPIEISVGDLQRQNPDYMDFANKVEKIKVKRATHDSNTKGNIVKQGQFLWMDPEDPNTVYSADNEAEVYDYSKYYYAKRFAQETGDTNGVIDAQDSIDKMDIGRHSSGKGNVIVGLKRMYFPNAQSISTKPGK